MSSEKLRKYLAYYQKVLKAEPENIEARLRLAAIFRELGRTSHAVEEYSTASKLLAKEGLPLEAIAACKAVLELEPHHTEIRSFLARLFAIAPEAMGSTSRIARPLDSAVLRQTPARATPAVDPPIDPEPITLRDPKPETTKNVDIEDAAVWDHEKPTQSGWPEEGEGLASEPTSPIDEAEPAHDDDTSPLAGDSVPEFEEEKNDEVTREIPALNPDELTPPSVATPDFAARDRAKHALRVPDDSVSRHPTVETFEVNVFDMESLGLDDSSEIDFSFLDEFEGEVAEFTADEVSETYPAVFKVDRDELPVIPLLSQLPQEVFVRLLGVIDLQRLPAGTTVLQPNHSNRTLFIIVRGQARVTREVDGEEVQLAIMGEGEFFGEFVLLTGRTGAATVRAQTDCEILALHEDVVNEIADEYPEIWDVLWEFYYRRMLNNLLAQSDIFRPLGMEERRRLAEKFRLEEVVADEVFLREGDPCRDLYLVLNGEVCAERRVAGSVEVLATMREGEFFGLASSLNEEPYLADLRAVRDTTLLMLPASEFRNIADNNSEVNKAVELAIMSRRALNSAFTSGITAYAEHGVAKFGNQ